MPVLVWGPRSVADIAFSGISASIVNPTSVSISWDVTPASQGEVRYGTTNGGPYPFVHARETNYLSHHVQSIIGLSESTTYYYVLWARDANGREEVSSQQTFDTTGTVTGDLPDLVAQVLVAQPSLAVPGLMQTSSFSDLGTEVVRVGTGIEGQGHRYAIPMPWNSDESLLFLDYPNLSGSGSTRPLLDGQSLEVLTPTNSAIGHFRWHPTIPTKGFGYSNPNIFRRYNVAAGGFTVERSWTLSQYSQINYTGGNGRPDNTGRYHPIQFKKSNGDWGFAIIDLGVSGLDSSISVEERVMGNSSADINTLIDASSMSWDGSRIVVIYEVDGTGTTGTGLIRGTWSYENGDLSSGVKLSNHNSHSDVGQLANGAQVMVQASCAVGGPLSGSNGQGGYIGTIRLDNAAWNPLIPRMISAHVGCANIQVPDYASISNFSGDPTKEIWGLQLSTGLIRRFAHSHFQSRVSYAYEPQAAFSPSMTRVVWRANWDGGPVGCFVAGVDVIR